MVYGANKEHNRNLRMVLSELKNAGLTLKKSKCKIGVASIEFLGHTLSSEGIKLKLVVKSPIHSNKDEVKSFLGLAEYMSKFIKKKFSDLVQPIRSLLKKGTSFEWVQEHTNTFNKIKEAITLAPCICNLTVNLTLWLLLDKWLLQCAEEFAPPSSRYTHLTRTSAPWFTPALKESRRACKRLERAWRKGF